MEYKQTETEFKPTWVYIYDAENHNTGMNIWADKVKRKEFNDGHIMYVINYHSFIIAFVHSPYVVKY